MTNPELILKHDKNLSLIYEKLQETSSNSHRNNHPLGISRDIKSRMKKVIKMGEEVGVESKRKILLQIVRRYTHKGMNIDELDKVCEICGAAFKQTRENTAREDKDKPNQDENTLLVKKLISNRSPQDSRNISRDGVRGGSSYEDGKNSNSNKRGYNFPKPIMCPQCLKNRKRG